MLEQFELMKMLHNSLKSVRVVQREDDIGKMEQIGNVLIRIEDFISLNINDKIDEI
jgi:hypothetical protein